MRIENIDEFSPCKDRALVTLTKINTNPDDLYFGEDEDQDGKVNVYYGTVNKLGPLAQNKEHANGIEVGDTAIFSQFAGNHIATADEEGYKLLRGYDIMAKTSDVGNINGETLDPVSNRVLIEVQFVDTTSDGVVLTADDARDPRLADLDYGKIIKVGPSCKDKYEVGTLVAYDPYCGQVLREQTDLDTPCLKVLVEDDILMKN